MPGERQRDPGGPFRKRLEQQGLDKAGEMVVGDLGEQQAGKSRSTQLDEQAFFFFFFSDCTAASLPMLFTSPLLTFTPAILQ